ncbi:MAG: glycosyltransferase family 2 protein [Odoribacter splanchnicus]
MLTASIVLFHHKIKDVQDVINCVLKSCVSDIYMIDNSANDALRKLEKISERVHYIHSVNLGYGAGHNIAIREAIEKGATYHVVLNPDIYFEEGTLEKLEAYMEKHDDVGQIMPKVYYPNGDLQYLCKLIPTPADLIFKRFLPAFLTKKRMEKFQLQFSGYNKIMNIPYLSGCFMFFRVSALQKIGLFDERFFMYPEDIDITRRMHEAYKTIFFPEVSIVHAHAAASKTNPRMLRIHMTNMIKYFNKWGWFFDSKRRKINKQVLEELKNDE